MLAGRPLHEPPTESYAETRGWQRFTAWGFVVWRQIVIHVHGRIVHRADFGLSLRLRHRPRLITPRDVLLAELDSRLHHETAFEADHARQSTYDALGFHWVTFTPNQIEHRPASVLRAIDGALARMGLSRADLPTLGPR